MIVKCVQKQKSTQTLVSSSISIGISDLLSETSFYNNHEKIFAGVLYCIQ